MAHLGHQLVPTWHPSSRACNTLFATFDCGSCNVVGLWLLQRPQGPAIAHCVGTMAMLALQLGARVVVMMMIVYHGSGGSSHGHQMGLG